MLKPYIGYSRSLGSTEGAILIFAHNTKEAKKLGFPYLKDFFSAEFTDVGVNRLWDAPFVYMDADKKLVDAGIAHVIDNPTSCTLCGYFGHEEINIETGICVTCENQSLDNHAYIKYNISMNANNKHKEK